MTEACTASVLSVLLKGESMSTKLMITDLTICEAYVWTLEIHRNKYGERDFRWLHDDDFPVLHALRRQLAQDWHLLSPHERTVSGGYYRWRVKKLDSLATEKNGRRVRGNFTRVCSAYCINGHNTAKTRGPKSG